MEFSFYIYRKIRKRYYTGYYNVCSNSYNFTWDKTATKKELMVKDKYYKSDSHGGIFGGIKLRQFNLLLNTLISSLTKTSPPGLEPGTKP